MGNPGLLLSENLSHITPPAVDSLAMFSWRGKMEGFLIDILATEVLKMINSVGYNASTKESYILSNTVQTIRKS